MRTGAGQETGDNGKKVKLCRFILCAWFFAFTCPVVAQQPTKISRIGALHLGTAKAAEAVIQAFQRGLRSSVM